VHVIKNKIQILTVRDQMKEKSEKELVDNETHIKSHKEYYFNIQYPDNSEEDIIYEKVMGIPYYYNSPLSSNVKYPDRGIFVILDIFNMIHLIRTRKNKNNFFKKFPLPRDYILENDLAKFKYGGQDPIKREKAIQSLVNKLGSDGYKVDMKYINLFMKHKIDKIIFQKNIN
jgi:hypothetical protein